MALRARRRRWVGRTRCHFDAGGFSAFRVVPTAYRPRSGMSLFDVKNTFRVAAEYQPLLRWLALDADGVFSDPRVVCWRKLADRENCTLDADAGDGRMVRLH